ncbi:unnamed protein product, partial [Discosporangium mesarthrocarpum]
MNLLGSSILWGDDRRQPSVQRAPPAATLASTIEPLPSWENAGRSVISPTRRSSIEPIRSSTPSSTPRRNLSLPRQDMIPVDTTQDLAGRDTFLPREAHREDNSVGSAETDSILTHVIRLHRTGRVEVQKVVDPGPLT